MAGAGDPRTCGCGLFRQGDLDGLHGRRKWLETSGRSNSSSAVASKDGPMGNKPPCGAL